MSGQWKTIGNATTWDDSDRIDVIPMDDILDHDIDGDCVCGPQIECIQSPRGDGYLHVHSSLDGREAHE